MSMRSEYVKRWRYLFKLRIIEAMGGSCCICTYNKCFASLAMHHLDPSKKDFNIGRVRANPKSWSSIVDELRKCILLCHNCHNEVHNGFAEVPVNAPRFNEEFADYISLEKKIKETSKIEMFTPCPICSKLKPAQQINCSLICAGKAKRKIDWDKIDLQEELKRKSIVELSQELNCSDSAIHKRLKRLNSNKPVKIKVPSVNKNCSSCQKEVKIFHANIKENNFCDSICRKTYLNIGWPSDNELLEMKKTFSIREICEKLNKPKTSVYDRLNLLLKKFK